MLRRAKQTKLKLIQESNRRLLGESMSPPGNDALEIALEYSYEKTGDKKYSDLLKDKRIHKNFPNKEIRQIVADSFRIATKNCLELEKKYDKPNLCITLNDYLSGEIGSYIMGLWDLKPL